MIEKSFDDKLNPKEGSSEKKEEFDKNPIEIESEIQQQLEKLEKNFAALKEDIEGIGDKEKLEEIFTHDDIFADKLKRKLTALRTFVFAVSSAVIVTLGLRVLEQVNWDLFKKPPIEFEKHQDISFSVDSLRNPAVSMDQNESGEYSTHIYEAQDLLQRVQEIGFWLPSQAESYAKVYPTLNNAREVMDRNILLENIIEDRPMNTTWSYEKGENNDLVYEELNKVAHLNELNKLARNHNQEKLENAISKVNAELQTSLGVDVSTNIKYVFEGFWRIRLSRTIEGEDYSFYVNIDTNKKSVAILSYIPPTEILYAFNDFKSVPLIKDLLEKHPRLNIQLPPGIEDRIRTRRKSEREYYEKVTNLSATNEISQKKEAFESVIYVKQGDLQIISADKGPIGSTGVGPCVAICARGINREGKTILGFAHMEAGQNENDVLSQLEKGLESLKVPRDEIEIFLVGGWKSTEELQKRLLALSSRFNIKGIKINLKDKGIEYPEKKNYIDVVIDKSGKIFWGEKGELFKIKR